VVDAASKNANNGVAGLDSTGKINSAQLPAIAITSVYTVASQAAQLALTSQEGDVAVRTDESKSYIKNTGTAGTMADWTLLQTPLDVVLSVNGDTGAVNITPANIGAATTSHTHAIADTTGLQTALDGKAASSHTHTIANVTDLQTTLDGKQASSANLTTAAAQGTASVRAIAGDGTALTAAASDHSHTGLTVQVAGTASVRALGTAATEAAAGNHTHTLASITDAGTAASKTVPASGNAASTEVVLGSDTRLTNGRPPDYIDLAWSTDANYTIVATQSTIIQQTGTLTAARTITLPAANALPAGSEVIVQVGASATATNTVSIQRAGSDTINGGSSNVVVGVAWGMRRFITDGSSSWVYDAGVLRISNNLSDLASASTARSNLVLGNVDNTSDATKFSSSTGGYAATTTNGGAPVINGTPAVGSSVYYARANHVHPTDTTRAPVESPTFTGTVTIPGSVAGIVKATSGGVLSQNKLVDSDVSSGANITSTKFLLPTIFMWSNTAQSIATATTVTGIGLNAAEQTGDTTYLSYTLGSASGTTHTAGYITVNYGCTVLVSAHIGWTTNATGGRAMLIRHADSAGTLIDRPGVSIPAGAIVQNTDLSYIMKCTTLDTIRLDARQESGINLGWSGSTTPAQSNNALRVTVISS
jgi:oxalate decarboxylase/phosphoglucose isomerase-like protein (cupin superfamily)